jgi:8-oxo-dGTP pyrophosphatase MutT (NUDIX family)
MKEKSCGVVVCRKDEKGENEVLLVLRNEGFWEFPKGKIEEGENCFDTAKREVFEETGIFCNKEMKKLISIEYSFLRNGNKVNKVVDFFLHFLTEKQKVKIDKSEIADFVWVDIENAFKKITYPEMKKVAKKAKAVLSKTD